jgi:membrane fusion protein (multidrug efflux system)
MIWHGDPVPRAEILMKRFVGVALVVLVAVAAFYFLSRSDEPGARSGGRPPAPVTAYTISTRAFNDRISALGTLRAWESVDITSSQSQLVTEIRFDDGQRVKQGDILAQLKQDSERATLRELQARLADAEREVRRLKNLATRNQVAQNELDAALTQVEVVANQIDEIQARIADLTIRAPFDGVLGLREVSPGAYVESGQRLTTLDDISRMRLQFTVPARSLGFLDPGQTITARTPAFARAFEGRLTAIDSRVDPVARAVTARAVIENEDRLLRPGLLMEVEVIGPEREAMMVPEESLQSRAARHFVWKLEGEEAVRTEVKIGGRIPGWVELRSGVSVGDRIVRDGIVRLNGDRASVREVEPDDAAV